MALVTCLLALTSCGSLETPEYPDSNFSIVGTWKYHIPALTGAGAEKGSVYNADGWITFTDDGHFSFVIESNKGDVKGCGTYTYDEDSGVSMEYDSYKDIEMMAREVNILRQNQDRYVDGFNWGNEGDRVEQNYIKVHTLPVSEFYRVSDEPYDSEVATYFFTDNDGEDCYSLLGFGGRSELILPFSLNELYDLYTNYQQ